MPALSQAQQRLMAIAEHNPSALYQRNRGVLRMTHQQLHDFAATRRKGLPRYVKAQFGLPRVPRPFPQQTMAMPGLRALQDQQNLGLMLLRRRVAPPVPRLRPFNPASLGFQGLGPRQNLGLGP